MTRRVDRDATRADLRLPSQKGRSPSSRRRIAIWDTERRLTITNEWCTTTRVTRRCGGELQFLPVTVPRARVSRGRALHAQRPRLFLRASVERAFLLPQGAGVASSAWGTPRTLGRFFGRLFCFPPRGSHGYKSTGRINRASRSSARCAVATLTSLELDLRRAAVESGTHGRGLSERRVKNSMVRLELCWRRSN